jgi:Ca2+-binding RTX toxin-like protein
MLRRAIVVCIAVMGLAPASALANATISRSNNTVTYDGDNTADDALTISGSGGTITFSAGVTVDISGGTMDCTGGSGSGTPQIVTCTNVQRAEGIGNGGNDHLTNSTSGLDSAELDGGDGDDTLTGADNSTFEELNGDNNNDTISGRGGSDDLEGGDGNDRLDGGDGNDDLEGDAGTDVLTGDAGDDELSGSEGNGDFVDGGPGDDFVFGFGGDGTGDVQQGGPGVDFIRYSVGSGTPPFDNFNINLANGTASRTNNGVENDTATGFEEAESDEGNDTLVGTSGVNELFGDRGNDTLDGGGGGDQLFGGPGNDSLLSRDGFADRDSCGDGTDTATADQLDELAGCEMALVANVPPFGSVLASPRDIKAPSCKLSKLDTKETRKQFFKGVSFRVRCNERAGLAATAFAHVRRVSRGRFITSRVGDIVLGTKSAKLGTGTRKLTIKPSKAFRRALGKRFKVKLAVVGSDALGNRRTVTKTIRVKQ